MDQDKEIEKLREGIDDLDRELIDVLARRMKSVASIRKLRKESVDDNRHDEVLRSRPSWGTNRGLSGNFVRDLFERILKYTEKNE